MRELSRVSTEASSSEELLRLQEEVALLRNENRRLQTQVVCVSVFCMAVHVCARMTFHLRTFILIDSHEWLPCC